MSFEKRNLLAIHIPAHEIMPHIQAARVDYGQGWEVLPDDARYVRAYFDSERDLFVVIYEHEQFLPVAAGVIPWSTHVLIDKEVDNA